MEATLATREQPWSPFATAGRDRGGHRADFGDLYGQYQRGHYQHECDDYCIRRQREPVRRVDCDQGWLNPANESRITFGHPRSTRAGGRRARRLRVQRLHLTGAM